MRAEGTPRDRVRGTGKQDLLVALQAAGLADRVGAERILPTLPTAVQAYEAWHADRDGRPPAGG